MATAENPELSLSLVLDEEQKMLAENAAGFFAEHSPVDRVRTLRDAKDAVGFSKSLWREMAELGFVGMNIPESYGGTGLGFFELAIVLEQVGRRLSPEPFLSTVLLGAQAILRGGSEAQKSAILPAIAAGERIVTVAYVEERSRFDLAAIDTTARRTATGFVIDGKKTQVLDGHVADTFIVSARTGTGHSLLLVDAKAKGVDVVRQTRLDGRNVAIVSFTGVEVEESAIVGVEGAGLPLLSRVVDVASIGLAAEMLGAAEQTFEDTVEYLKVRKQFGVAIGSFQALQHRAARLFIEIALLRSAVLGAARTVDVNPADVPRLASLAKARANDTLIHVTNEAVQMHGGVGVTDECNVGFYVKRARACEATFGDSAFHRARWATFNGY